MVVLENEQGVVQGYREFYGDISEIAKARQRPDGGVEIRAITESETRRAIADTLNAIAHARGLPRIDFERYLRDGYVSCHHALYDPPEFGGRFTGPGLLTCRDLVLVGPTRLSPDVPIWRQRALQLSARDYPDRMILTPIQTTAADTGDMPSNAPGEQQVATWDEVISYLRNIPVVRSNPSTESPGQVTLDICLGNNRLTAAQSRNNALTLATIEALQRFESLEPANARTIVNNLDGNGFDVSRLDDAHLVLLKQIVRETLTRHNIVLSSSNDRR
jgi:hypothetical protein